MYKNHLYATNRMNYIKNKKSQPYKGCLLCGVANNEKGVIKKVLYKDKTAMIILNVFPYNTGHVQIVPLRHVTNYEQLTKQEIDHLFHLVKQSIIIIKKAFNPAGFNLGMNIGVDVAGGSIDHLHIQLVPRYKRDLGFMEVTADTKVMPMSLDDVLKKLKKHVAILKK